MKKNNKEKSENNKSLPLSENMKNELRNLREQIISEYDESEPISVRVNLLPKSHNAMSEYEKIFDPKTGEYIKTIVNDHNRHADPINIAIHETTPNYKSSSMVDGIESKGIKNPGKPEAGTRTNFRYDALIRKGNKNPNYGQTIGYHARVDYPGLFGRAEIVILEPAVCSPDQLTNKAFAQSTYGIERLCGEEQNYHLAVANQAMLTAFVLKEMGYDPKDSVAMKHIFPHNFYARNRKACPARMLYASNLVEQSKKRNLTTEEMETIKDYVPWEVFMGLVQTFFQRDKYPQALEEKFIYDMSDYDAYMENPEGYNYSERRALKPKRTLNSIELKPRDKKYAITEKNLEAYQKPNYLANMKVRMNEDNKEDR